MVLVREEEEEQQGDAEEAELNAGDYNRFNKVIDFYLSLGP